MDLFDGLPTPKSDAEKNTDCDGLTCALNANFGESTAEPRTSLKRKSDVLDQKPDYAKEGKHVLRGYSAEMQGERDAMEDRYCLVDNVTDPRITKHRDISTASFYGVFDGHAGRRAANFVADGFLDAFLSSFILRGGPTATDLDAAISSNFIATYKSLDTEFIQKCIKQRPAWKDGCTATTLLVINNTKLFIANVGDSQSIVCRYDAVTKQHKAVVLTTEHSPALYEERLRIQQQGGHVRDNRLDGVLEVSRSIGDLPYKQGTGLISTPSIRKYSFTADDKFIVVACDGLWKALTPSEVVDLVLSHIKDAGDGDIDAKFTTASVALAREAVKRLTGDNVTVLLVRISSL